MVRLFYFLASIKYLSNMVETVNRCVCESFKIPLFEIVYKTFVVKTNNCNLIFMFCFLFQHFLHALSFIKNVRYNFRIGLIVHSFKMFLHVYPLYVYLYFFFYLNQILVIGKWSYESNCDNFPSCALNDPYICLFFES